MNVFKKQTDNYFMKNKTVIIMVPIKNKFIRK